MRWHSTAQSIRIWSFWTQTWPLPPRPVFSRKHFRRDISTAASLSATWWALQQALPPQARSRLSAPLPCLRQAVPLSRSGNSVGYPHLNVKIGATHAGISVGEDGATHQCNEDIALMRTIPGMVVINPSDDVEAKAAVKAAIDHDGPVYLRFGRLAVPVINDNPDYKFELGKGVVLREGKDITLIATGLCVSETLEAAKLLEADGIDAKVINIHTSNRWMKSWWLLRQKRPAKW